MIFATKIIHVHSSIILFPPNQPKWFVSTILCTQSDRLYSPVIMVGNVSTLNMLNDTLNPASAWSGAYHSELGSNNQYIDGWQLSLGWSGVGKGSSGGRERRGTRCIQIMSMHGWKSIKQVHNRTIMGGVSKTCVTTNRFPVYPASPDEPCPRLRVGAYVWARVLAIRGSVRVKPCALLMHPLFLFARLV